jgi:hypothetical protein
MALLEAKSGCVPPAIVPVHRVHHLATEISVWAPVVALGALTLVAGIMLWLRVTGYWASGLLGQRLQQRVAGVPGVVVDTIHESAIQSICEAVPLRDRIDDWRWQQKCHRKSNDQSFLRR